MTDLQPMTRLFKLYALGDRLDRAIEHPRAAAQFEEMLRTTLASRLRVAGEVLKLEDRLGLSPKSRLALGVALMAGRKAGLGSLDDLVDEADTDDD